MPSAHRFIPYLLVTVLAATSVDAASKFNRKVDVGAVAPAWQNLTGTDDKPHSLADHKSAPAVLLLFTCNHCPTSAQYEGRIAKILTEFGPKGVVVVGVNPGTQAVESLDRMKKRAAERKVAFEYLRDDRQRTAKDYGATSTPQWFLLGPSDAAGKRKIAYMGAFDDDTDEDKVETHYVRDALNAVLAGRKPEIPESRPFGCPIDFE